MSLILSEDLHEPVWAELPRRRRLIDPLEDLHSRRSDRMCSAFLGPREGICGAKLIRRQGETPAQFQHRTLCGDCESRIARRKGRQRPGPKPKALESFEVEVML